MSTEHKSKKRRNGVIICGAYGMGNAGDEAIVDAIVAEMRSIDDKMPICVLSRKPQEIRDRLGVESVHTFNFFGFTAAVRRAQLYINGGGSLIQDVTSRRSLWYYLWSICTAGLLGCRVMMYGCGIGPVLYPGDIRLTRRVLNRFVDAITLREPDSIKELKRFGVTEPEMQLTSDPVFSLPSSTALEVENYMRKYGVDPDGRYACFSLRRWPGFEAKAEAVAICAKHVYAKHGLIPLFVAINHKNDGDAAAKVIEKLGDTPYFSLPDALGSDMAIGIMSKMELVVSMRLHGLIFAASAGAPLVGISYDPKVTSFMSCIDGLSIELDDLEPVQLMKFTDMELERDKSEVAERVERLRKLESGNTEIAARLLGKDR